MIVIAVVGKKRSGKTKTVDVLVRGLTGKGCKVAIAKHVSEQGFMIDTKGKDAWLHAQAGARTVMLVAPCELTRIKKRDTRKLILRKIIQDCRNNTDVLILEGFKTIAEQEPRFPR